MRNYMLELVASLNEIDNVVIFTMGFTMAVIVFLCFSNKICNWISK